MNAIHWTDAVQLCHRVGEAYVLATVMGVAGSVPREPGSKMVITAEQIYSTIGGGQLEFAVMLKARELLINGSCFQTIEAFPLAASGQCCGGNVSVLLELNPASSWSIAVFGAGHVAQRLIDILSSLPCRVIWCDSRSDLFPAERAANVYCQTLDTVSQRIDALPANTDVLVLTHDHSLDFELCQHALARNLWVGLIGSVTKSRRFGARLNAAGINADQLKQLSCPVGLADVAGKLPMEIAVSISAQLIQRYHARQNSARSSRRGLGWRDIKAVLAAQSE